MPATYDDHTGNGSNKNFTYTYPVLKTEDVKVSVDGVTQTSGYTVNTSNTRVEFTTAPANNAKVRVFRETTVGKTSGDEDPKAIFAAGSSIKASELNANQEQALFGIHELQEKIIQTEDVADGAITSAKLGADSVTNDKIANDAVTTDEIADNSVTNDKIVGSTITSAKIANNTIVNADVNASAAIAGTKIAPDFGSQNITTTGTVDGRNVSADGTKLDGIETGATADQTSEEIQDIVGAMVTSNTETGITVTYQDADGTLDFTVASQTDQNFTNADHTKLDGIEAGATADQTGAEIKTAYEANSNTNAYIDTHNALVGGITSTASELNKLDGVTATTTNLNIVSGMGKQTTISDSDTNYPTSGAVVDYVAAQITGLGGITAIANEDSFPTSQPASGEMISISDAQGVVVNGSGVSTTARTSGNGSDNVTINGFPSTLYSETLAAGNGLIVVSTGSSHTYTYHKLLASEADVKQLSDDINDFNSRYRIGSSNPSSNNDDGDLFFNTSSNKMLVYNATGSSWDEVQSVGNFYINTISSYSGTGGNSATFNGSAYRFVLSNAPTYAQQLIVSVNGVIQKPNAGTSQPSEGFVIDGSSIIFSSAPPSGADYFIITIGAAVNIGAPSDNSVGNAAIIDGAIDNAAVNTNAAIAGSKLADDSITEVKLDIHNAPSGTDKFLKYTSNGMEWVVPSYTTNTNTQLTEEQVEDFVGGMVTGNTETGITVTYQDSDGTLDFVVAAQEGTAILSTGESGGAKYLREDGDGTCSWQSVSQYSTPLTTQGDILYRDGSGDQRLAKGTAGQVLKMNSGATAPEWGTAGVSISNDANNRVTTADGSAGLVGEANLTFDGSTLAVTGNQTTTLATQSQGYESPATVSANWSIGANNNAMFPGPMTVASGVTVTVPANRTLTVV